MSSLSSTGRTTPRAAGRFDRRRQAVAGEALSIQLSLPVNAPLARAPLRLNDVPSTASNPPRQALPAHPPSPWRIAPPCIPPP